MTISHGWAYILIIRMKNLYNWKTAIMTAMTCFYGMTFKDNSFMKALSKNIRFMKTMAELWPKSHYKDLSFEDTIRSAI